MEKGVKDAREISKYDLLLTVIKFFYLTVAAMRKFKDRALLNFSYLNSL